MAEPATDVETGVEVGMVLKIRSAILTIARLASPTGWVLLVTQETGTRESTLST